MKLSGRQVRRWICGLGICVLLTCLAVEGQEGPTSPFAQCPTRSRLVGDPGVGSPICLNETSDEIANEICLTADSNGPGRKTCVIDLIERLGKMSASDRCAPGTSYKALLLRQEISEMILTASLQVDGFLSEVDSETGQIRAVHDDLTDRRDTGLFHSNLANAVGTGGNAVGSAIALAGNTAATVGNALGAAFGGFGAFFGFRVFFQQRGPKGYFPAGGEQCDAIYYRELGCSASPASNKTEAQAQPKGCSPRMLYVLAHRENDKCTAGFHSFYDDAIFTYLESKRPRAEKTRKQELVETWGNDQYLLQNSYLLTGNADHVKLSITQLEDRTNKLADLRAKVSLLNRDLSRLMGDLASGLRCPPREDGAQALAVSPDAP